MLTGIIISYDGERGVIRSETGIQCSFTAKQIKSPGTWRPKGKEAVVVKLQDGQHSVARSVRQLPPGHLKAHQPPRLVPARYVGWGVAVSRFAPGIEVSTLLRTQHNVRPGSVLLVRYTVTDNALATATDITVVAPGSEQQKALAAALLADEQAVKTGKAELLEQLEAVGEVSSDEQYEHLKGLLQQWDAWSMEPGTFRAATSVETGQRLVQDGYAHYLEDTTLLNLLEQATDLTILGPAARRLPAVLLKQSVLARLARLAPTSPLADYRLVAQWLKAAPELMKTEPLLQPAALSQLPLPELARFYWWEEGLVLTPDQSMLVTELGRRLHLALTDTRMQEPLHRLVRTCRRNNCLRQVGREMLLAIPVAGRLPALGSLVPLADAATRETWVRECLMGQVNDAELYAAWEQNKLFWLPTEFIAAQLLTQVSATVQAVLQRLAERPDALPALAQSGRQGPWLGERAQAIKAVLQVLQKATIPPAPRPYWETPQPTSGLPIAWAKEAMLTLQQTVTDLPGAAWLEWWLADLLPEPAGDILLTHFFDSAAGENPEAGWRKLSAEALNLLEEPLLAWVRRTQPVAWVHQAQKVWVGQPQLAELLQRVLALTEAHWPAAAQVDFWLLGGRQQPGVGVLQAALAAATVDQARAILTRATTGTLPELLDQFLAVRPNGPSAMVELGLEIARQYAPSEPSMKYRYNRLVSLLVQELDSGQYYDYWQRHLLPPPPVEQFGAMVQTTPEAGWPQLFQRYPVELLLQYVTTVLFTAERKKEQAQVLLTVLSSRSSYEPGAVNVRNELLAGFPDEQQLQWWLDGLQAASPGWEVIARALATEEHPAWRAIAEKATRVRLTELLAYLPTATRPLLTVVADLLCEQRILKGQYPNSRVPYLLKFAEAVTARLGQEPALILPWLRSMLQQCQPPNAAWANSRHADVEYQGRVRLRTLVRERVLPHLDAPGQLQWWAAGLAGNRPDVEQAELVEFVVRHMNESIAGGVAKAYDLPEAVVRAWQGLGNLQASLFEQQFPAVKGWLPTAAHHPALLRAVDSYLDAELTAYQRANLWLYGYPTEAPGEGGWWTVVERMQAVLRLSSLGTDIHLIAWLAPGAEEIEEWLAEQYWQEEDQQLAGQMWILLRDYHALAVVELPAWGELEDGLLSRCEGVVKVRLWMTLPAESQERTFNYYTFRRGYSRLRTAEQKQFLELGLPYLQRAGKAESDVKGALHLRRRWLMRQQDGVSVYRVCLAHCYCPGEGLLEVELADKKHTRPCAYPGAEDSWNGKFLQDPWSGCPVLAYVDDQTLELIKIQGLEAALTQHPVDGKRRPWIVYQRDRDKHGTTDNPASYWEDMALHDKLSAYLLELAEDAPVAPVVLTERMSRQPRLLPGASLDNDDETVPDQQVLPWQTVLYTVPMQEEVLFVWAPQFAHANRATYVFRAPLQHLRQALERLHDLLQGVQGIRSALLAPGRAPHRLRCHLGYVRNIRGQRGLDQAFARWQKRLDAAIEAGPNRQHPYNPESDFLPLELEVNDEKIPPRPKPDPATSPRGGRQAEAHNMLRQMRHLNARFLAGYPA
ncbi:hypothetical protein ACFPAF_04060 [Hymenobacter endophyticus]|uniref:Uncharacterized protein n=1 Tax=Hymenobacter endophyticus TaxID=3076335 RepID=A0ABU3TDY2_9BACT|nr:hypothetical protein [Hymenobacter endophyticus]MDU0369558.1 hypothetical protein [Hymenobacter endophyticus]